MDTTLRLRDALVVRENLRAQLRELENDAERAARQPKALAADIRRHKGTIAAAEQEVESLRSRLASEKRKAEAEKATLEEKLAALGRGEAPARGDAGKEEAALRNRLAKLTDRIAGMEQGISAQMPEDIPPVISIATGRERTTADIMQDPALRRYTQITSMDWPGATVPERLMMLFREGKKTDSRRSIVISSIVIVAATLIVLGATLINGALNPGDGQSPIGRGETIVPVLVADADEVGTIEMTVEYNDDVLTGIQATPGPIAASAVVECNLETPGTMRLRLVDVTGLSGSGAIMLLRFKIDDIVLDAAVLDVTAASATDSLTLTPVAVTFEDGSVNTATLESVAPVLRFPG